MDENESTEFSVLSLEDSDRDFEIISEQLIRAGYKLNISRVVTENEFFTAISNTTFDIILADYNLPNFDASGALQLSNRICPEVPFICVSGSIGEIKAIELLKQGAVDYVLKDRLDRLPFAVKRALIEAQEKRELKLIEGALKKSEEKYRTIFENVQDVFYQTDLGGTIIEISPSIKLLTEYSREEIMGMPVLVLYQNPKERGVLVNAIVKNGELWDYELVIKTKSGKPKQVSVNARLIFDANGKPTHIDGAMRDITNRKLIEETLKENNSRLELAMQSANMAWWEMNISTGAVIFDKRKAEMLGYQPDQFNYYTDFMALVHPDDCNKTMQAMKNHLDGMAEKYEAEYRIITKSGNIKWFYDVGSVISRDSSGKPEKVTGLVIDVTEHKRDELDLIISETRYRRLFETAKDGILILDAESGKILDVNPFLIEMLGYTKDVFIQKTIWELGFFRDIISNKDKFIQLQQNKYVRYDDLPLKTASGAKINVEFVSNVYSVDHFEVIQCYIRDISKRKIAEQQVMLLGRAVEQSPATVVITDRDGNIEYANRKFTEVTGYSSEEAKGKNPRILKSGEHSTEFYKELWGTILSGNEWKGEFHNKKKNGDSFWESVSISPIFNSGGEISNFVAIKEDVTEKLALVKDLVAAKEKAEASNRLKTAFLNNISHEIRTPLNGILGFAPMVIDPSLSAEEKESFLEILNISSRRLMQTVTDYMDISLITSGNMEPRKREFAPASLVDELLKEYIPLCNSHNLSLQIERSADLDELVITSDKGLVTKVLKHLMDNALKFTKNGQIVFRAYAVNGTLGFKIKDTGIGIKEEALPTVFDRFVQEDIASTRGHEGSGLGLAIVNGIVNLLGGSISVESIKGTGSTFTFLLPGLTKKISPVDKVVAKKTKLTKHRPKLLIAEDDDSVFIFLEIALKSVCDILRADDGQKAVDICRENQDIQLVLMDIKMPRMNGLLATAEIKKFRNELPIVALTAYVETGIRETCIEAGCDDYLTKPLEIRDLIAILTKFGLNIA